MNHADKERVLHAFYLALLGTTSPVVWDPNLAALLPLIAGLSALELPFSEEELKKALWSMRSDSSPGLDGFGPAFFKAFWPGVKDDLMSFVTEFHSGGAHLSGVNQAFIALLPKTAEVVTADGFSPISLQNCVMKIITRILTTRLQQFIEQLVAFEQSCFIARRCIVDNFLYAAELAQCCRLREAPTIPLNQDFKKAFDSVNWCSLDAILEACGFGSLFRTWIRGLLTSGKAAVLLNGVPGRWMECKNGLRQGDPLSPYLYLIVAGLLRQLVTACSTPSSTTSPAP
jgi:hypothetical protein